MGSDLALVLISQPSWEYVPVVTTAARAISQCKYFDRVHVEN